MAFLPGLKKVWNALKAIILVILIVFILIVAWEALLVGLGYGAVEYSWMGLLWPAINTLAVWAANNSWLFALAALVSISIVSPHAAQEIVQYIGEVASDLTDLLLDAAGDLFDWSFLIYVGLGYLVYKYVSAPKIKVTGTSGVTT